MRRLQDTNEIHRPTHFMDFKLKIISIPVGRRDGCWINPMWCLWAEGPKEHKKVNHIRKRKYIYVAVSCTCTEYLSPKST